MREPALTKRTALLVPYDHARAPRREGGWPRQDLPPRARFPAHLHAAPYAAVVVAGSYREAGDGGRRDTEAGHVTIHTPFTVHADEIGPAGSTIVNIPLTLAESLALTSGRLADPEALLRALVEDSFDVVSYLKANLLPA